MCQILKGEFVPYLRFIMPLVMQAAEKKVTAFCKSHASSYLLCTMQVDMKFLEEDDGDEQSYRLSAKGHNK